MQGESISQGQDQAQAQGETSAQAQAQESSRAMSEAMREGGSGRAVLAKLQLDHLDCFIVDALCIYCGTRSAGRRSPSPSLSPLAKDNEEEIDETDEDADAMDTSSTSTTNTCGTTAD